MAELAIRRLDTFEENRLNGGFCDAAGDHVCASPGLARADTCKHVRHLASGLIPASSAAVSAWAGGGPQQGQNQNRRHRRSNLIEWRVSALRQPPCEPYAAAKAPRHLAGARTARINQRVQHETYLPTFRHPPQAYPWFPRAHEDPWRPCRHQRSSRQGPQAPGNLRAGLPVRMAGSMTVRRRRCMNRPALRLALRMARSTAARARLVR